MPLLASVTVQLKGRHVAPALRSVKLNVRVWNMKVGLKAIGPVSHSYRAASAAAHTCARSCDEAGQNLQRGQPADRELAKALTKLQRPQYSKKLIAFTHLDQDLDLALGCSCMLGLRDERLSERCGLPGRRQGGALVADLRELQGHCSARELCARAGLEARRDGRMRTSLQVARAGRE